MSTKYFVYRMKAHYGALLPAIPGKQTPQHSFVRDVCQFAEFPNIAVQLADTGYAERGAQQRSPRAGPLMTKPFSIEAMAARIKALMEE
jgi:hypothetical protein